VNDYDYYDSPTLTSIHHTIYRKNDSHHNDQASNTNEVGDLGYNDTFNITNNPYIEYVHNIGSTNYSIESRLVVSMNNNAGNGKYIGKKQCLQNQLKHYKSQCNRFKDEVKELLKEDCILMMDFHTSFSDLRRFVQWVNRMSNQIIESL
jgi:hypothetical protein